MLTPPWPFRPSCPGSQNPQRTHAARIALTNSGRLHGRRWRWWNTFCAVWCSIGIKSGWVGSEYTSCIMSRWFWSCRRQLAELSGPREVHSLGRTRGRGSTRLAPHRVQSSPSLPSSQMECGQDTCRQVSITVCQLTRSRPGSGGRRQGTGRGSCGDSN